jgi:hypothetical protein
LSGKTWDIETALRVSLGTYLMRRIKTTLSTTLFIERGFFLTVGGFSCLGYPIRDMQASIRFSLLNMIIKINVQHDDAGNPLTSLQSSKGEREDISFGTQDRLAR